jgi:PAS domain S-box-containing protein
LKTRNFLRRIIDSSVDAIISADLQGRVLVFNRAAERIYARTTSDVIGSDVRDLYPAGVAKNIMRMIRQNSGRIEGVRTEVLDAKGQRVPVSLSAAMLMEGETPVGSVGIFTDLREKVRMEQRLAQAQEQILAQERQAIVAELAGAAAHELNQPLTSVMGYAELLKRKLDPQAPGYGAAEIIFNEAERMAEIVRKIGKITKYETKSYVGQQRILDLDKASAQAGTTVPPAPASSPREGEH